MILRYEGRFPTQDEEVDMLDISPREMNTASSRFTHELGGHTPSCSPLINIFSPCSQITTSTSMAANKQQKQHMAYPHSDLPTRNQNSPLSTNHEPNSRTPTRLSLKSSTSFHTCEEEVDGKRLLCGGFDVSSCAVGQRKEVAVRTKRRYCVLLWIL